LRCCTWLVAGLFALLILTREYVDWSGRRHWAAVQEMLSREGESLDLRKIAPPPVPDEENFCAIPALKDLPLASADDHNKSELGLKLKRLIDAGLPDNSPAKGNVPKPRSFLGAGFGKAADMGAWAAWLRGKGSLSMPADPGDPARDVLAALSGNDALVSELALGLSRPESQWTPSWKTRVLPEFLFTINFPHYWAIQKLTPVLCLRSTAAAREDNATSAHESLLIATRITEATAKEPFLIGTLVAIGCSTFISNAVWELCDAHSGTAEQFHTLQRALSRLDFYNSFLFAERSELTFGANSVAYLKRTRNFDPISMETGRNYGMSVGLRLLPDGWFDANAAALERWHFDYFIKPLRDGGFEQLLAKQKELQFLITECRRHRYSHLDESLAVIAMPALLGVSFKVIYAQCLVNESIAACALERYRIEHNTYPDTLEAANRAGEPSIPLDVISGKPMGYRKTPDGKYALWCVGFDGKDDGGKRVLDATNPANTRFSDPGYLGDWVWDFQAK